MLIKRMSAALALLLCLAVSPQIAGAQQQTKFELGAQTNVMNADPAYPSYPSYPAYPAHPITPPPPPPPKHHAKAQMPRIAPVQPPRQLQANVTQQSQPPLQANVQQEQKLPPGVLPQQLLGQWAVIGSRTSAKGGAPQYVEAIDRVMPATNQQEWNIVGQPGSYQMASSAGASGIGVAQCTTSTAFIRHQYQVGNCIAREAYVIQLDPSGQSFQGVMRCAVVKPGEPAPRFQAQYNLMGRRK